MTRPWLLALVCLFFARGVAQIASSEPKPIFVRCGTLIDGKSDRPQSTVACSSDFPAGAVGIGRHVARMSDELQVGCQRIDDHVPARCGLRRDT